MTAIEICGSKGIADGRGWLVWLAAWVVVLAEFVALLWLGWLYSRHAIVISVDKGPM
jgi:hypothetical protein